MVRPLFFLVRGKESGFTLIELSIVLVIIGLIASGIVVAQALIKAASLQAALSQVQQFKIATNTFKSKYGQLPGDMLPAKTTQFGFFTMTGSHAGIDLSDNDGLIGVDLYSDVLEGYCTSEGSAYFRHLAEAKLINLSAGTPLDPDADGYSNRPGTPLGQYYNTPFSLKSYLPANKERSAFFCAGNLTKSDIFSGVTGLNTQRNVYTMTGPAQSIHGSYMEPSLSPVDLYSIDLKVDDGLPLSGKILNTTSGSPLYWNTAADIDRKSVV